MAFTSGEDLTAARLNEEIRKVLENGQANAAVATSQTTTSTSYTNLATVGPEVTIVSTGTKAMVFWKVTQSSTGGNCATSPAVSGTTTIAASDSYAAISNSANLQAVMFTIFTITPGSNTYTLKYRVVSGTGTYADRQLFVWAP